MFFTAKEVEQDTAVEKCTNSERGVTLLFFSLLVTVRLFRIQPGGESGTFASVLCLKKTLRC